MSLGKKIFHQAAASVPSDPDAPQGLALYLDANDEDSIESGGANAGGGGDTWFDIANHDLNVPLIDKASNLKLHLNASDTTSYSGSGDWKDISGSGIDGTISGATFESDTRGYFHFDGSNDVVTLSATDTSPINLSSETHTIEFWVNFDNLSNDDVIVGKFGGSNTLKSFQIQVSSTNKLTVLERDGSSNNTFETTGTFSTGAWTHFAYTRSASNVKLYINGTLDVNHSASNAINAGSTQDITIGNQTGASVFFDGRMSVLRIYNTTLTDSEVAQNFRADCFLSYSSIYSTNLNMNLDAANYTSSDWADSVGSNDGTISGASFDKELGNYFDLDGSNDKITVAGADLNPANTKSIGVWFNTDSTSSEQYIISNWSGSGNNYGYHLIADSGTLKAWVYSQAQNAYFINLTSGGTITAGKWHYAVLNIGPNASDNKLFLDGVLTQTASSTSGTFPTTAAHNGITIGVYGASSWFNGKIGQIKAYSTQLTSAQVVQNYLATKNNYPNGYNFTLYSSPSLENSSTPYYFRFDAAADEARLSSVDIDISMGFTVSIYLKRHTAVSGYAQPFRITGTGYTSYLFLIAGHKDVIYYSSSGTGNSLSTYGSSGDWDDNSSAWRNVIFTRENTPGSTTNRGEIYVNGSSHATATNLSAITNITNIYVNRDNSYPNSRNAQVDVGLIKIWQKPFSDAEALAEYNATKTIYGL